MRAGFQPSEVTILLGHRANVAHLQPFIADERSHLIEPCDMTSFVSFDIPSDEESEEEAENGEGTAHACLWRQCTA